MRTGAQIRPRDAMGTGPLVPCANDHCSALIARERALIPLTHGLCPDCNATHKPLVPESGTRGAERRNADADGWTARLRDV